MPRPPTNKSPSRIEVDVRSDVAARIDDFAQRGECVLISEYIRVIPLNALCMTFGIDPNSEKADRFHELANGFLDTFTRPEEFPAALGAIMEFGIAEVLSRREHSKDDYLIQLANAELDGKPVGPAEIGPVIASMLVAGHETTVNGLAGVLFEVLRRHGIRDQLVADPTLVRAAVDEGMRIPSFYGFCRRALEDTEVSGVSIPATPAKGVHTVATAGVTKYLL